MTQNPNLAALSAAGVSVWLDDLSRDRLQTGNLQDLIDTKQRRRRHHQPVDLPGGAVEGHRLRRAGQRARRARRRRRRHHPHRHHRRRPQRLRRAGQAVRAVRRRRRPGVHRGRPAAGPRHRQDDPAGDRAVEDRRPAQPADQDPGHAGRPARDHRRYRRGHFGQRHADLLRRTAPRGDGRLPGRPGEGQGSRPRPVQDPFGRIVLRVPGGHRDRQAAGEDRHRRSAGAARPGRRRQRPAGLRGLRGGVRRRRALRGAEGRRRARAAAAVGIDRREEPGLLRHAVRHRARRARTR